MALTLAIARTANTELGKESVVTCTFDSSYPTGGETLDLTASPFTGVDAFTSTYFVDVVEGPYDSNGAKITPATCSSIHYDPAASRAVDTGVLLAYYEDGTSGVTAQVANTTNLSTVLCRLFIVGT